MNLQALVLTFGVFSAVNPVFASDPRPPQDSAPRLQLELRPQIAPLNLDYILELLEKYTHECKNSVPQAPSDVISDSEPTYRGNQAGFVLVGGGHAFESETIVEVGEERISCSELLRRLKQIDQSDEREEFTLSPDMPPQTGFTIQSQPLFEYGEKRFRPSSNYESYFPQEVFKN